MKWFKDGDQIAITNDDFVDLQTSPAVFTDADNDVGKAIQNGGIRAMPFGALFAVRDLLKTGGGELVWTPIIG